MIKKFLIKTTSHRKGHGDVSLTGRNCAELRGDSCGMLNTPPSLPPVVDNEIPCTGTQTRPALGGTGQHMHVSRSAVCHKVSYFFDISIDECTHAHIKRILPVPNDVLFISIFTLPALILIFVLIVRYLFAVNSYNVIVADSL